METPAVPARLIGSIFVEKGLISDQDLERALAEQSRSGKRLGEILVAQFGVSRLDLASALADQWAAVEPSRETVAEDPHRSEPEDGETEPDSDLAAVSAEWTHDDDQARRPIGEIFVEQGTITEEQLEHALTVQRETGQRLGEVLVGQGSLSRLELASALADQWSALTRLRPPAPPEPQGRLRPPGAPPERPVDDQERRLSELADGLRARIDGLDSRLGEHEHRLGAAEAADWRAEVDRLRAEIEHRLAAFESASIGAAERLAALATELPPLAATIASVEARVEGLGADRLAGAIEELDSRVGAIEADDELGTVRAETVSLAATLRERLDAVAEELSARLGALESRTELEELRGLLVEVERQVREAVGGEMRSREALDAVGRELRGRLDELSGRLEVLAGTPDPRIASFADQVSELQQAAHEREARFADRLQALEHRHDEIAERDGNESVDQLRLEIAARLDELWEAVKGVQAGLEHAPAVGDNRVDGLVELVGRLAGAVDTVHPRLEELERRLDEGPSKDVIHALHLRLDELGAAVFERVAADDELRERATALEQRADGNADAAALEGMRRRLETLADGLDERESALEQRLLERTNERLERVADRDAVDELNRRVDEQERRLDESLGQRVDALASGLHRRIDDIAAAVSAARDELAGAAESLRDEFDAGEARSAEYAANLAAELDSFRLDVAEARERTAGLAGQLDDRESALRDELLAALASLAQREEEQEPDEKVVARLAELDRRLAEQAARADEQVSVTEHALRDGLAALAGRLGENEAAYVETGNALRRSIERLGRAISETDDRIAARAQANVEQVAVEATAFVAFAPTQEGYRLIACDGALPPIGNRLVLPGCEGELVVTRIGPSPLPLDERPCAYLEQV